MDSTGALRARPARGEDAAAIARIYNEGIEDRVATFETEPRTAEQVAAILAERRGRYPLIVVERAGAVVGWAWAGPYSSRPCYSGVGEFSVYVGRAARGAGVGRAAMDALIAAAEALGFWKLTSRVLAENAASLALLRAVGFREVGRNLRHARLDGAWRDTIEVERLLGEAALP